ncbi:phenylalanine--tRNA ligase subunit alpha [bacterium]|jgi:phenylalanyl-tRNA synthetase alpha chain|nr:phenylalanine--tRNA ligase subunit alpha [bacterium]
MIEKLDAIGDQALRSIHAASSLDALEQVRIAVLGKKGSLSEVLKGLGAVAASERPKIGGVANEWKRKIEAALEERKSSLEASLLQEKLQKERIDVSIPARIHHRGALHIISQTTRRMMDVFGRIGFDVTLGPEAETEFLNFEAVNIPADHPARDMQDTFFLGPGVVLRTHTSSVQMRSMRAEKWPIRIVCPGAVYRCDYDATHSPMFHQVEGLWVDRGVRMSDLKGVLEYFAREMFGSGTKIRLRPSYFPFVEPGAEVDVSCFRCRVKPTDSCRVCKGTGWLEILGAGMVHPRLFEMGGYLNSSISEGSSPELTGFAFGIGVERIAMLLHEVPDLRMLYQGDVRLLSQF